MVHLYGGWLTDAGSYLGRASRGILDVAGRTINTVVTRGGADSTELVSTSPEAPPNYVEPALIAGAAVLGFLILAKAKKRRR